MKGVGRYLPQTFIDTYSKMALAKLYIEKSVVTVADDMLNNISSFSDEKELLLYFILTGRGRRSIEVELRAIPVSFIGRLRILITQKLKTMKNEFYAIAFRKNIYHSLDELEVALDHLISKYYE